MRFASVFASFLSLAIVGSSNPQPVQNVSSPIPIAKRAAATLTIAGYADFLAPDGNAVWVTAHDIRTVWVLKPEPQ